MSGASSPLSLASLTARLRTAGARSIGDATVEVSSLGDDSRQLAPGSLFVARVGALVDGTRFVDAAVAAGASAVLCERSANVTFEPRIEVEHLPLAFGLAAQELAGRPSEGLSVVGVTGTNGKTTTTSLVDQALRSLGIPTARLGTLGFFMGDELIFETLTTPQPHRLAEALAIAKERGARVLVMEVSSHALAQERVAGVRFEVGAFTNLSLDHLDYHGTLEAYGETKARLFSEHRPRKSVICVDGAFGRQLAERFPGALAVSVASQSQADIVVERAVWNADGIEAELRVFGKAESLHSRLVGQHNLENLLVGLGILLSLGVASDAAVAALGQADSVPGRLERCDGPEDDLLAVVDYAHTPDALERVLAALRAVSDRPLVCVFGCGGDRDRSKRAPMARAAAAGADVVWLTSDNPRTEDPAQILSDARLGLEGSRQSFEEPDRARAIERAVLTAPARAMVLVAGKGHETYQLVGEQVLPFDDRVETRAALAKRRLDRREVRP